MRIHTLSLIAACLVAAAFASGMREPNDALRRQVIAHERGFAASMAARDIEGFAHYLADEAVFMPDAGDGGGGTDTAALRGKAAILAGLRACFDGPTAPFSWEPERVEVIASGTLAHSSGPVRDAQGRRIGSFASVWRLEAPGRWAVVFDQGCDCRTE